MAEPVDYWKNVLQSVLDVSLLSSGEGRNVYLFLDPLVAEPISALISFDYFQSRGIYKVIKQKK